MSLKRDPICGMSGSIELDGYGFCSEACVAEYKRRLAAAAASGADACPLPQRKRPFADPLLWAVAAGAVLATVGLVWPAAGAVSAAYREMLKRMAGPIALGLLLGGWIDYAIPKEYIIKMLARPRKRVIVFSTLLGFLASACSHGCLALSIELHRKGASTSSVISFLLASPWASLALTFILFSLFGLKGAVIAGAALGVAFITGLVFQKLERRGWVENNPNTSIVPEGFSIRGDIKRRLAERRWTAQSLAQDVAGTWTGTLALSRMVIVWLQLGLIVSALAGHLLPHSMFMRWFGATWTGLLATVLLASVLEVCSEGTAPIAFELYRHTGALGNAFAFLMGGVVTDYTELGALWTNVGKRATLWMLAVALPLVIAVGWTLNRW